MKILKKKSKPLVPNLPTLNPTIFFQCAFLLLSPLQISSVTPLPPRKADVVALFLFKISDHQQFSQARFSTTNSLGDTFTAYLILVQSKRNGFEIPISPTSSFVFFSLINRLNPFYPKALYQSHKLPLKIKSKKGPFYGSECFPSHYQHISKRIFY